MHELIVSASYSECNGASLTRPLAIVAALLLAACGDVEEREACDTSGDCPAGEYCAHTPEGAVCWPDAVPPTVTGVAVDCGTAGCVRDGELVVEAEVADDLEVFAVEATVGFDPTRSFPLVRGEGTAWSGSVSLAALDFPGFELEAVVTVRALDGARNEATGVAGEGQRPRVGRVRWAYPAGASLSPPAVSGSGEVVIGRSALSDQLLVVRPDGTKAWSLTVGSGTVTSPPSIGAEAIWVAANDGKLYAVKPDGSGELSPSRTCAASGVAKGPPAVLTTAGVDVAFGAFSSGRIYASGPTCVPTAAGDPFSGGAAIGADGAVFGAASTAVSKTLRQHTWDGEAFGAGWTATLADSVIAPLALADGTSVLSASIGGHIEHVLTGPDAGAVSQLTELGSAVDDSPIILSNGDIVVGDAAGELHRLTADGTAVWDPPPDLGAAVHAPMALTGGLVRFLVATADGVVHALDDDGEVLWHGPLTAGMALGAGNLHTPPGGAFSTAYFGGADGKLHAVVVEGRLDTTAPWPKAWHDARNTSRAAAPF